VPPNPAVVFGAFQFDSYGLGFLGPLEPWISGSVHRLIDSNGGAHDKEDEAANNEEVEKIKVVEVYNG